jgi:hypothetical protein
MRDALPPRILRDAEREDAEAQEGFRASQRRGQWTRLVRKIDELRFRANVNRREPTEAEERDIRNCEAELVTLEAAMEAAGQAPR